VSVTTAESASAAAPLADSRYAVARLAVAVAIMTLGSSSMYVIPVVLPSVQAEFGVARADASLPYFALMIGFAVGAYIMGWISDRFGVMKALLVGAAGIAAGYALASTAGTLGAFVLAHGLFVGMLGSSVTFSPLVTDISMWFVKRRGIAVAICASGNYLGGALWPPIVQRFIEHSGWRPLYLGMAVVCGAGMAFLALFMRRRPPALADGHAAAAPSRGALGIAPAKAQALLCIAGIGCCVAMSMPQVHIVAYCGDLGYGPARGAEMLALMLGFGIASRLVSGYICDHIGGLRTLLLGSALQGVALLLFLPFDGLVSLYVISALFGLFQGGIVPSYAIIVREYFPASQAGARVGAIIMCTLLGMALGGWMSGKIFDLTGSYRMAFVNGLAFNALNLAIATFLLRRASRAAAAQR
jgi:MFS family permease